MEKFIKIVFVAVPTLLMLLGVFLVIKAAQFWLVTISPSQVGGYPLVWDTNSPIDATVYLPSAIRAKDSPIKIDLDINRKTGDEPLIVKIQMTSKCDYISFENSFGDLTFDAQTPKKLTFTGQMKVRNMTPPSNCEVTVQTSTPTESGTVSKTIPVDALTGNAIATMQLILGFAGTFLGFKGLKGFAIQK